MEELAEFKVKVPLEFLDEVRQQKDGKRLEATDRGLRQAFAEIFRLQADELFKTGQVHIKDVHKLVLDEIEQKKPEQEGYSTPSIRISVTIPPCLFETATNIKKEYSGGLASVRRKDVQTAAIGVLKELADRLLLEGEAEIKDVCLLLLEKMG